MGYRWDEPEVGLGEVDRTAVALGVVFQFVTIAPIAYYSGLPEGIFFGTMFGGLLAGAASDNHEGEFMDGAMTALIGVVGLGVAGVGALYWFGPGIDTTLIAMFQVMGVILFGTPLVMLAGALGGFIGANARRVVAVARS